MASTSVHFPKGLLEDVDQRAAEAGMSRNRFIVESCRSMLRASRREWPAGFFSDPDLTRADREALLSSAEEFIGTVIAARRSRRGPAF